MATPARYQATQGVNVGGWAYESEEQTRFAFTCAFEGFGLPSFDDHIDTLPDCPVKADLLTWRSHAFSAFKSENKAALRGWLQAAWVVWKTDLTFDHIRPTLILGTNYSQSQSERAKKPRAKLSPDSDGGPTIKEIISTLALSKSEEFCEETAKGLWPHFFSRLDEILLNPEENGHDDEKKARISYDYKSTRKNITFGRFSNIVSESRKNKSR